MFSCSAQRILSGEIYTKTLLLLKKKKKNWLWWLETGFSSSDLPRLWADTEPVWPGCCWTLVRMILQEERGDISVCEVVCVSVCERDPEWQREHDHRGSKTVYMCVCMCVCVCVWSGWGRLTWQRGLTLPAWLLMQAFSSSFLSFFFLSSPFFLSSHFLFSLFLSFLSFCVCFFPYPHTPSFPFVCLFCSLLLSLISPSLPLSLCFYAQGKGLSLYHRVEPLSCSHFIHMETGASLLFSFPLPDSHTGAHTHIKHRVLYCSELYQYAVPVAIRPNSNKHTQSMQTVVPVNGADAGNTVVVTNSLC